MRMTPVILVTFCTVSCSMREGMNDRCEWPSEPVTILNPRNPEGQRHLIEDVRVAEELGIRYHDGHLKRGTAVPDQPQTRDDCDAALFAKIAVTHAVTLDDLREARQRLTRGEWDPRMFL